MVGIPDVGIISDMIEATFIGFGEAGYALACERTPGTPRFRAFDIKHADPGEREPLQRKFARADVFGYDTAACALRGSGAIFSVVTADQALNAARTYAPLIDQGAVWFDMNSVAPETKRLAAAAIEEAGGRYVDVAVMAPVEPLRRQVPLLVSGQHVPFAMEVLKSWGFMNVETIAGGVGAASAVKMVRSVMVKGLEALAAECLLAAEAAGVRNEVLTSLDRNWRNEPWASRADYNLDRMMVHGLRRAAEMDEVVKTLEALGTDARISRATADLQRRIGELRIAPPEGLDGKLDAILGNRKEQAA